MSKNEGKETFRYTPIFREPDSYSYSYRHPSSAPTHMQQMSKS